MIGLLKGMIAFKNPPYLIIDIHGVGYKVLVSNTILTQGSTGDEIQLYTHTYVREDALELYGFIQTEDLRLFEMLIGVSGVGCKSALGIFSVGNRSEIINAIITGDVNFFTAVPRLGKKNAQKIIIELKSRLGDTSEFDLSVEDTQDAGEVMTALRSFGFSNREAHDAIRAINGQAETTAEKVKLALKYLGK